MLVLFFMSKHELENTLCICSEMKFVDIHLNVVFRKEFPKTYNYVQPQLRSKQASLILRQYAK